MDIIEGTQIVRFIAALIFVIALMGGLSLVMRRLNGRLPASGARKKRMRIVEILPLDGRRKAIILQRDNKEHLVILGANGETLVESGIESPQDIDNVENLKDAA